MISSLTIKNVASYDNNGVTINDLKKVNFLFGFNGSGKSTIAKYLKYLSLNSTQQNSNFRECANIGYDDSLYEILTFSEDFIEENFRRSADYKGVFSLNQSNKAIDQQITEEETNIQNYDISKNKYQNKIDVIRNDEKNKTEILQNSCWNQRTAFSTFAKISLTHSGNKLNYLQEIRRILQNPIGQILSLQDLTKQYNALYERDLKNVTEKINARAYLKIRRLEIKLEKLLQEVIVGNEDVDIAGMIRTLNSRSWVEQGLNFLKPEDNICPFCQKETIDVGLRSQFEKYFDETYKNKLAEISELKALYSTESNAFTESAIAIQNVFNPNNLVSNIVLSLNTLFADNLKIIDYKIEHSNEKKSLTSLKVEKNNLSEILRQIKFNNELYNNSDKEKRTLIENIWKYMADQSSQTIRSYDKRIIKYSRIIAIATGFRDKYNAQILSAQKNIEYLRSQTVNTKDAVDNINSILKNAGFEGFEIAEKDNKINNISRYYLKRQDTTNANSVFNSLSEGEKNFISFLYFYQLCLGTDNLQRNGNKKKIIVIDDPVSSLDSQALFIVSTLIHKLIERKAKDKSNKILFKNSTVAQVFVFTHNTYFYKEVSLYKRPICADCKHFKIYKLNNRTSIISNQSKFVPNDYSLMWDSLKSIKKNLPNDYSLNIMISNSMRRIIESYVNFMGYGESSWDALNNDDTNTPGYYIKCAFISMINDESHKVSALDDMYFQKIITEQPQILFDVFASIFEKIGKQHYEMMMNE